MAQTFEVDQSPAGRALSGAGTRSDAPTTVRWHPVALLAFRFCLAYGVLFALTEVRVAYPMLGSFGNDLPQGALTAQYHFASPVVNWVADKVLGADASLIEPALMSGDQAFFWVLTFCRLLGALLVTVVWSALDRRRANHVALHKWFVLVVRLCLAAQMLAFGFAKVFPLQMSLPLTRLVEPFGDFGMLNVLWSQVGSSPQYEVLLGCAEVAAGLLLLFPRTALAGALLALVELAQVLLLNVTYQVPLKIFTAHLLLLSLVVIAPHARRLATFLLSDKAVGPYSRPPLFRTRRAVAIALAVQLLFGAWLVGSQLRDNRELWQAIGSSAPKPPLYGIWDVITFTWDDEERPPLTTDADRWNRFIVDTSHTYQPGPVSSQRMDGSVIDYAATFDPAGSTVTLVPLNDPAGSARFAFSLPGQDRLSLDGVIGDHRVRITLEKVDLSSFPVLDNNVRWVQDAPYQPRLEPR